MKTYKEFEKKMKEAWSTLGMPGKPDSQIIRQVWDMWKKDMNSPLRFEMVEEFKDPVFAIVGYTSSGRKILPPQLHSIN